MFHWEQGLGFGQTNIKVKKIVSNFISAYITGVSIEWLQNESGLCICQADCNNGNSKYITIIGSLSTTGHDFGGYET